MAIGAYGMVMVTRAGGAHGQPRVELATADKGEPLYAVRPLADKLFFAGEGGGLFWSSRIDAPPHPITSPYAGTFFGLVTKAPGGLIAFGLRGHAVASTDGRHNWTSLYICCADSIR